MAELTAFGYSAGDSLLHRMDARFKIFSIIVISLVNLNANFRALGLLTVMLLGVIVYARLPLAAGIKELRYFLILLLVLLFLTHSFFKSHNITGFVITIVLLSKYFSFKHFCQS